MFVQGFQVLVETEWLDFGHKFADRCGHGENSEDLNERCPVFLQWLDCVHQLQRQFPCSFEFNEAFLVNTTLSFPKATLCNFSVFSTSRGKPSESSLQQRIMETINHLEIVQRRGNHSQPLICTWWVNKLCVCCGAYSCLYMSVVKQVKLVQHTYSCLFGTFLCNSGKEREDRHVQERTCSIWSLLRPANRTLRNMLYSSHSETVLLSLR